MHENLLLIWRSRWCFVRNGQAWNYIASIWYCIICMGVIRFFFFISFTTDQNIIILISILVNTQGRRGAKDYVPSGAHITSAKPEWRSQDLGKNNVRGSEAIPWRGRVWEGGGRRASCRWVNGAIWCICPVFSTYSANLYLILWKAAASHAYTQLYFPFFSLSLPLFFFFFFFWGGALLVHDRPPPGFAPLEGPGSSKVLDAL